MFEKIIQENGGEIMREEISYEMALKINKASAKLQGEKYERYSRI